MRTLTILALLGLLGVAGGGSIIYFGLYNVAATEAHLPVAHAMLEKAMRASVHRRSRDIAVPALDDPAMIQRGLSLYRAHCTQCHGAPGVAPDAFALGLNPPAANLAHTARTWDAAELFWVIKHGVRTTGMPAWEYRLNDAQLWSVTAFVKTLPAISPRDYQALAARPLPSLTVTEQEPRTIAAGNPARGKTALGQYACVTCHDIPGVAGAYVPVGPPLGGIAKRKYIAGVLPNTTENMIRWLREPQKAHPDTAMPDLGVNHRDAADMTAYLYTLK